MKGKHAGSQQQSQPGRWTRDEKLMVQINGFTESPEMSAGYSSSFNVTSEEESVFTGKTSR